MSAKWSKSCRIDLGFPWKCMAMGERGLQVWVWFRFAKVRSHPGQRQSGGGDLGEDARGLMKA